MPRYRKPGPAPIVGHDATDYPAILPRKYLADGEINPESIAYYRSLHDLTQPEFGEFIGVERTTIHLWENGKRQPSYRHAAKLNQLFAATDRLLLANGGMSVPHDKQLKRLFDSDATEEWLREILFGVAQMGESDE